LETLSRKFFFDIINNVGRQLKTKELVVEQVAMELLDALRWNFTARDHGPLASINLFTLLHRGNGQMDSPQRKAWGTCKFEIKPVVKPGDYEDTDYLWTFQVFE
jgi:hypothetical protein